MLALGAPQQEGGGPTCHSPPPQCLCPRGPPPRAPAQPCPLPRQALAGALPGVGPWGRAQPSSPGWTLERALGSGKAAWPQARGMAGAGCCSWRGRVWPLLCFLFNCLPSSSGPMGVPGLTGPRGSPARSPPAEGEVGVGGCGHVCVPCGLGQEGNEKGSGHRVPVLSCSILPSATRLCSESGRAPLQGAGDSNCPSAGPPDPGLGVPALQALLRGPGSGTHSSPPLQWAPGPEAVCLEPVPEAQPWPPGR